MGELRLEHVTKRFGLGARRGDGGGVPVLGDVSFTLSEGEFVSLIGPSGCGKTTVLNLVAGLDEPSGGSIFVDGKRIVGPGLDRGVVFQEFALFPWLTVADNIAFGLRSLGLPGPERRRRVDHYVELVGLGRYRDYHPNRLSGGMRQRVGLGRAFAIEPSVLLMDEPFGALDSQTRETMQGALGEMWLRTRKTVLFVTHDIREAIYLSDRVLVIGGRPASIMLDLPIALPRPRKRHGSEFQSMEQVLEAAIVDARVQ
jgi:NitT/TauT family transport system ATP-binding protein